MFGKLYVVDEYMGLYILCSSTQTVYSGFAYGCDIISRGNIVEHRHCFFDIFLSGKPRVYSYGVMFPGFESVEVWIDGYDAVGR